MTVLASPADTIGTGLIGFLVVLALVVACVLLFRSMTRHLKSVPREFPAPDRDTAAPADGDPPAADAGP